MPERRLIALRLFVAEGEGDLTTTTNALDAYDVEARLWFNFATYNPNGASVPSKRWRHTFTAAPAAGLIWAFGGTDGAADLQELWILNVSLVTPSNITCICKVGYERSDGATAAQCTACGEGTYKGVNGTGPCVDCAAGTYLNETAGSACASCPANTVSGKGSANIADCICDAGYWGNNGQACTPCATGEFMDSNGSQFCYLCSAGFYMDQLAATACFTCPNSSSSRFPGSTKVTDCRCNPGHSGPDGGVCIACALGRYAPATGSSNCTDCQQGSYLNVSAGTA
eukprot:894805-Rhodomonas_salina.1